MFAETGIVPNQVCNERMEHRSNRYAHQDQSTVEDGHSSIYCVRIDVPALLLYLRQRNQRASDSTKPDHDSECHGGGQQQQIDRIELTGPCMKGTASASEPGVVVLMGLQPLMHEGRHHVKRDQCQNPIQEENAIGPGYSSPKVKPRAAPARIVEPKPE